MPNAPITENGGGSPATPAAPLPGRLRRQAALEAAGHFAVLLLFGLALQRLVPVKDLLAGSGVAALSLAVVHVLLWRHLPGNRRSGEPGVASTLGLANRITLLRGLLISLTAGCPLWVSLDPGPVPLVAWLPGGLYLTAAILDGVDGAWARRSGTTTPLGKTLDVQYDALGVLVASAVAVAMQRLPVYYLAAGGAYYIFQLGLWWRRRRGEAVHPAGSRTFARLVAGCQMGFLGIALLPILSPQVLAASAPVFLLPLLAGFAWDWGVAVGRIGEVGARRGAALLVALAAKGPPLLRVGLLAAAGMAAGLPEGVLPGARWLAIGLTLMVVAGVAGRTAALLLSLLLAGHASVAGASPGMTPLMMASLIIMLAGTGDYSLWRPEDHFLLPASRVRPPAV